MGSWAEAFRAVTKDLTPGDVHADSATWKPMKRRRKALAAMLKALLVPDPGLYVARALTPACDAKLREWAQEEGLPPLDANLHVTIVHSRRAFPWLAEEDTLVVPQRDFLGWQRLGTDRAVVLKLRSPSLQARWKGARRHGATWDYPAYTPHVTLYYNGPLPEEFNTPPFPLEFGPEVAGPRGTDVFAKRAQPTFEEHEHPRDSQGQFVSSLAIAGPLPKKAKRPAIWLGEDGNPLDELAQSHLNEIAGKGFAAPGYTNQRYFPPNSHSGRSYVGEVTDAKGRSKRFYLDATEQANSALKTKRVRSLADQWETFNTKLDGASGDDALALRLIAKTGMRPGSDRDTGAAIKAFGATNMPTSAATVVGDRVDFAFQAKNGKLYTTSVEDRVLAKHVKLRQRAGEERLFDTDEGKVRDLFKTLTGDRKLLLKDIRTAHGTAAAVNALKGRHRASTEREFAQLQKDVSTTVSGVLQNTPKVALEKYILDSVWSPYRPLGRRVRA
jgi:hypothetical protein